MTDLKISQLNTITGANVSDANDLLPIVDSSGNETKAITRAELFKSVGTITTTGDVTVGGTINVSPTGGMQFDHPSSGNVTLGWEDDYLRFRFGGTDTPEGLRIDGYDALAITLDRDGSAYFGGNVGIGLTSPTVKLDVNGTIRARGNTDIDQSLSVDGTSLVVNHTTNRVGIRTATPDTPLDVRGPIKIENSFSGREGFLTLSETVTGVRTDRWTLSVDNTDSNAFYLWDDVNSTYPLAIYPGTSSGTLVATSSGVGINTTSPERLLHVQKGSGAGTVTSNTSYLGVFDSDIDCVVQLRTPNTASGYIRFSDPESFAAGYVEYDHSSDTMYLAANGANAVAIDSSQNVGIGTSSPARKLDVSGAIRAATVVEANSTGGVFDTWFRLSDAGTGKWDLAGDFSTNPITGSGTDGFYLYDTVNSKYPFAVYPNSNNGTLTIRDSRVGINTTAPVADLTIKTSSTFDPNDAVNTAGLFIEQSGGTAGNGNFSTALTLSKINSGRPFGAIAGVQTGTDADVGGLAFFIHSSSSSSSVLSEAMRIDASGNVGIGTSSPNVRLHVSGSGRIDGDLNVDSGTLFVGNTLNRVGLGTITPSQRLDVVGNVTISGSLSKGSGSFKIDHPLWPETHHLVHSFVEGPQADNIYRGKVTLVDGRAEINLDEAARMTEGVFVLLNGNVQCFTSNETHWCPVRGSVEGNILTIEAQDPTCTDTISWMVVGERIDPHIKESSLTGEDGRIITEPQKSEETLATEAALRAEEEETA